MSKRIFLNALLGLIVLTGISNILCAFPWKYKLIYGLGHISLESIQINRTLSALTGFSLLILANGLYKRLKVAWLIAVPILAVSFSVQAHRLGFFHLNSILGLLVLLALVYEHQSFTRDSDPFTFKLGIILSLLTMSFAFLYGIIGFFILHQQLHEIHFVRKGIDIALQHLFGTVPQHLSFKTAIAYNFAKTVLWIHLFSLIASLVLILKPFVFTPIPTTGDRKKVFRLVKKYGFNPISFLALEHDKKYFFASNGSGVIAYVVHSGVAVAAGDPLCPDNTAEVLLNEFTQYCRQNNLDICFSTVSDRFLKQFKKIGYGYVKYGEEAIFDLTTYTIKGSKTQKVRQMLNAADKAGINVIEYEPLLKRDYALEQQIIEVSQEWLSEKKSSELSFLLGSISLDFPQGRKYYLALNAEKKVEAFLVCVPYAGGTGYYLDVTRKRPTAPKGTMEKLVISCFNLMKDQGVKEASLGLAPLANVRDSSEISIAAVLLDFAYEKMNNFYGFKSLHQYKRKYNPTAWITRYLIFYPKVFTPKIIYGLLKAQNPKGISDFVLVQMKNLLLREEKNKI
ncbi:DUF2156 domain-containing protein [Bacillota bacterium LX-D]|nr:DUF2156 domain-containing protein [Bacillota bacterium LX-D]